VGTVSERQSDGLGHGHGGGVTLVEDTDASAPEARTGQEGGLSMDIQEKEKKDIARVTYAYPETQKCMEKLYRELNKLPQEQREYVAT
jgi:hypothetical protein